MMNNSESNKQVAGSHTPGPWRIDEHRNIKTGNSETLLLGGVATPMTLGDDMREGWANARRIVACVNYCDGADTNALELDTKTGRTASVVLPQLTEKVIALESQRDQLATKVADLELALFADNQKRSDVERERDQLLKALDKLLKDAEQVRRVCLLEVGIGVVDEIALDLARAAIAAVNGGAE